MEIWNNGRSYEIMKRGLMKKFTQYQKLKKLLLSTENAKIVEDTSNRRFKDFIWGMAKVDGVWKGENLPGKALMEVREELSE